MGIQDYLDNRFSRIRDFYTPETEELKLSCSETDKVRDVLPLLAEPTQAGLAVLDKQKKAAGIITERDIVKHVAVEGKIAAGLKVMDLMTHDPVTIDFNASCTDGLKSMLVGKFRNLIVLKDDRFVGIISILEAAKGRLVATTTKSEDLFVALSSLQEELPSSDLKEDTNSVFEIFKKSGKNILIVTSSGLPVDYLTSGEVKRLKLQAMSNIN